ncbi:hydroxyacylglutathione hydrolase [Saccharobesus litoralis]|uniref:Hydroxyacylglutathione hydrolase n=1 Tax=Saccharobesus litoralis TaxID=2172099 RepID=A0A2S0VUF4_9ALTE|nr:hydroxyacylglutathione hydrolase [Saccharobesus litoralis]AWB67838.1 hydroxyacylglutathione hydrolase [Saccharobesus litoralis]
MISVTPIPAFNDNYIWKISSTRSNACVVVDPGCAQATLNNLQKHEQTLAAILITHHHKDHIGGINKLTKAFPNAKVYAPQHPNIPLNSQIINSASTLTLPELEIDLNCLLVPGHTLDHIAYYSSEIGLFCGDTLFSAGCGRMFEGTPPMFLASLTTLANLPKDTAVYCAHEYTLANLQFALTIEPDNQVLQEVQKTVNEKRQKNMPSLPSSIAIEKAINPFLRCHLSHIQQRVAHLSNQLLTNEVDTFTAMRKLKDCF